MGFEGHWSGGRGPGQNCVKLMRSLLAAAAADLKDNRTLQSGFLMHSRLRKVALITANSNETQISRVLIRLIP